MKRINHLKYPAAMLAWLIGIYTVLAVLSAGPAAAASDRQAESHSTADAASFQATPSSAASPSTASPSNATPSQAQPQITFADTPSLIALEAGEADSSRWNTLLPRQLEAFTDSPENETVWCDISWSVSDVNWNKQGVYLARGQLIPPEGYIFGTYIKPYFTTVISIHPPGTSQVMDVYTSLGYYGQRGHTWTFAMNTGQDISPLVETLKGLSSFTGILDDPNEIIHFTADWDFSAVDTTKPGIYPIYRRLKLQESSLPPDLDPQQIWIPEYWKRLPVLLSVEEPGKPQLYGVLENPDIFFGSYAKLSEEEYGELEVWYSIDKGSWTLQTDEGLMETDRKNYSIHKDKLEDGTSYSFYLKLAEHTSRILTVQKDKAPLVWFFWTLDGNRDGTLDVDFPSFSQPPPDPPEEETTASPAEETTASPEEGTTGSGSANLPDSDSSKNGAAETAFPETGEDMIPKAGEFGQTDSSSSAVPVPDQVPGIFRKDSVPVQTGSSMDAVTASQPDSIPSEDNTSENHSSDSSPASALTDSPLLPMELVDQWTTQISGKRVKKLLEFYPEYVVFQKESISVLVSSDWLKVLNLADSDILTIRISPEAGHEVTILINQKEPTVPPVYQVRLLDSARGRTGSSVAVRAVFLLLICFLAAALTVIRRKKA